MTRHVLASDQTTDDSQTQPYSWISYVVAAIGVWYAFSGLFLMYPQLLHSKQTKLRLPGRPKYSQNSNADGPGQCSKYLLAHRGGSCDGPENTLETFLEAEKNGIDVIECDVHLTKDKRLIVFHDFDFERTCGDDRKVLETNFADLPQLKQNVPVHFLEHECFQREPNCKAKLPLLEEVFEKVGKDQIFHIEIKNVHNEEAVRTTVALVQKFKRQSTTVLGNLRYNDLIRTLDPTIPTFSSWADGTKCFIGFILGLLPFMHVPFESLSCPYLTEDLLRMKRAETAAVSTFTGRLIKSVEMGFMLFLKWAGNWIYSHLNKRGVLTNLWVINDAEDVKYLLQNCTVAGIMTDRALMVKELMQQYEQDTAKSKQA